MTVSTTLSASELAALQRLVRRDGAGKVAAVLGVTKASVLAICLGQLTRNGTRAIVKEQLARLAIGRLGVS